MFFKKKREEVKRVLPAHIAIIMDGNGRWAKKRSLPRTAGHVAGSKTFKEVALYANRIGIKHLTVYAFSTENWKRPKDEIDNIMNILRNYLKDTHNFKDENIRLRFIGNVEVLPEDIKQMIADVERDSAPATGMCLNIAMNYGGRDEIVTAVKNICEATKNGELDIADINESLISDYLYTKGQPDPDLIIRPSGEFRLSNYLSWQGAYSEFWFSDILWPDFSPKLLEEAIDDFNKRSRRFGGV